MGPHPVLITGLQLAITVAAGLLAGPSRPRRAGAMALAIVALGFPFVLPNEMVILRGILGFHGSVALLRVIDLVRDPGGLSAGRRVLAVITLVDTRQMERTSERFAVSEWLPIGVFAGLSAAGWWTALQLAPRLDHPASSFGLRWLGALVGFLWHNYPPAKLFMGDAGSYLIGYFLAIATLTATFAGGNLLRHAILAPLCVLAVPLYDTMTVVLIRLRAGRSPFVGDKSHFSHRLVELGMTKTQAVLTIYLATATCGLGALLLHRVDDAFGAGIILLLVGCVLVLVGILETTGRRGH